MLDCTGIIITNIYYTHTGNQAVGPYTHVFYLNINIYQYVNCQLS